MGCLRRHVAGAQARGTRSHSVHREASPPRAPGDTTDGEREDSRRHMTNEGSPNDIGYMPESCTTHHVMYHRLCGAALLGGRT